MPDFKNFKNTKQAKKDERDRISLVFTNNFEVEVYNAIIKKSQNTNTPVNKLVINTMAKHLGLMDEAAA